VGEDRIYVGGGTQVSVRVDGKQKGQGQATLCEKVQLNVSLNVSLK